MIIFNFHCMIAEYMIPNSPPPNICEIFKTHVNNWTIQNNHLNYMRATAAVVSHILNKFFLPYSNDFAVIVNL